MPIISINQLIDQAYASQVGAGDGDTTVSGKGSWSKYSTNVGYRMWLMDQEGNLVSDAGVLDLIYEDLPSGKEWKKTYNVKIQEWTGQTAQNGGKTIKFSDLNTKGFNGDLPRPIIAPNGGDYTGQGTQFRKWMTDGEAVVQVSRGSGSGSGGSGVRYTYKGSTSGGGSSSGNGSGNSNTGGKTPELNPLSPTLKAADQALGQTYGNARDTALAHKSTWTFEDASSYIEAQLKAKCNELCQGLTQEERSVVIEFKFKYQRQIGGLRSDFKSKYASHFIDTDDRIDYLELPTSNTVIEQEDGTIIIDLFDLAYATDDVGHKLKEKGNIHPLFYNNNLFNLYSR